MKHHRLTIACLVASLASPLALADAKKDAEMLKLASSSGCMTCHSIESGKPGPDGLKPIGPAWADVAAQYRGKPGATEFLTRVVQEGSNPYSSHWKNRVSGIAMPPNAVAITPANTRELVSWILLLK
ncbi:c-type cytochrome [Dechloromonas sp. XY25]|uniref:C-type cytochrome n=1 Tax=Dechloromonas hankyongensis TaxID=2908002 RepID=A0ABS9K1D1_9RHOO|nr:c-type cytochrome [Dechloromonas hankyongensis]MCG2576830.1 c-type cytochrome [Dechloromonas hankyongensis]